MHKHANICKGAGSEMQAVALEKLRNFDIIFCYIFNNLFKQTMEVYENKKNTLNYGFRCYVDEICTLLGCYTPCGGNYITSFRDNMSVLYSTVKK